MYEDVPAPHPLLLELEQYAQKEHAAAVERSVGRLLSTLVHAMQANRILDIGTGFGYATLWMALAQPPLGRIWSFDPNVARTTIARSYLDRAGGAVHVEISNQPALEVLPIFPQHNVDLAFIDAPAPDYGAYLDQCVPLLKRSGLIIFNGVLARGGLEEFNRRFLEHPELDATILSIAGGLGIGARIE